MRLLPAGIGRRIDLRIDSEFLLYMSRSRRWRNNPDRREKRAALHSAKMKDNADYATWSQEKLIERVAELEAELKKTNQRYIQ